MSIEVVTADSNSYLRRSSGLNYNSAYTVLFNYYSTGSHASDLLWALSGSTGSGSGNYPSASYRDTLRFVSGGALWLDIYFDPSYVSIAGASLSTGWHNIAVVRTNATTIKLRIDGTNYTGSTTDVTSREAVAYEFGLNHTNNGEPVPAGSRITNYKSWTSALADGDIDTEHDAIAFTIAAAKYSGSPMGDTGNLAANLTADGSGATWTAGSSLTYGVNDPGVTYGGGGGINLFNGKFGTLLRGKLG